MTPGGEFAWQAPAGAWEILRVGYMASGAKVSTSSGDWQGLAIDYLDRAEFERYWRAHIEPLMADAKPYLGKSLRYLVTDSWELGGVNWTPKFREEFRTRRGYDPLPFLPIAAGRILDTREASNRFLNDLRRTVADLVIDGHYRPFAEAAARYGLGIHPESGGPHGAPLDALETLGVSTFPQMEFWARSATHRVRDEERFFVKQGSSAAHIYGKTLVAAEGMTSIGPQWEESIWRNLKPTFDQAVCEGLNRLVWHTFTSSPKEAGLPGQEYFAGTHLNPNVTWWNKAAPFLAYINRTQFLLQQGVPVSDVLIYYGDNIPNFVQYKGADPAQVLPGYDYDVIDEYALTHRTAAKDGRIVLPEGTAYQVLVLPDRARHLARCRCAPCRSCAEGGAQCSAPSPTAPPASATTGAARRSPNATWPKVHTNQTARALLAARGVLPDFEGPPAPTTCTAALATPKSISSATAARRAHGRVHSAREGQGARTLAPGYRPDRGCAGLRTPPPTAATRLPLAFEPNGSVFVVFRRAGAGRKASAPSPRLSPSRARQRPVDCQLHAGMGRPRASHLRQAALLERAPRPRHPLLFGHRALLRHHRAPRLRRRLTLDLGEVREIAEVWLNGQPLGILWKKPFTVKLGAAAHPGANQLEIEVVNLWPNRLIGDQQLPPEKVASPRPTSPNSPRPRP